MGQGRRGAWGGFLAAAALAPLGAAAGAPGSGAAEQAGRYVLHGTAHVETTTLGTHDGVADLDVVVAPGAAPGGLALQLSSGTYACTLAARVSAKGDLDFDVGQRCPVQVAEPGARGKVDARLRSGRGRILGGALALELAFDISGTLSVGAPGGRFTVLGAEVDLPGASTTPAPVRGTVEAKARGSRFARAGPAAD